MAIEKNLGPAASAKDLESDPDIIILTLDRYEDDEEHQTHMPELDDITPGTIKNIYLGGDNDISW